VIGFAKALAQVLQGITVNTIAPGTHRTEAAKLNEKARQDLQELIQ
jgi:NAD(P)-dependent dehydrogenase (short-subunit alcohol dehydrogenase family)